LATKSGATTSSTITRSPLFDMIKSSLSELPPIRKNPRISVIIISSIEKVKSICGASLKLKPIFEVDPISFVT
jgi:hypothetical protein